MTRHRILNLSKASLKDLVKQSPGAEDLQLQQKRVQWNSRAVVESKSESELIIQMGS